MQTLLWKYRKNDLLPEIPFKFIRFPLWKHLWIHCLIARREFWTSWILQQKQRRDLQKRTSNLYLFSSFTHFWTRGVPQTTLISVVIGIGLFVLFLLLRKIAREFYMLRVDDVRVVDAPLVKTRWLDWIPYVIRYSKRKIRTEYGGIDAYNYLVVLRLILLFFAVLLITGESIVECSNNRIFRNCLPHHELIRRCWINNWWTDHNGQCLAK